MPPEIWDRVALPWRAAFEQAWEALVAGSPPVGAVVVDAGGRIVARGRSRRHEEDAPPNQLAGSRLAHAEVNALSQLAVDRHAGHTLYITLEPCFLCAAAIAIARVPTVRFAGQDPVWRFIQELPGGHTVLRDRWPDVEGPLAGPLGTLATLLPLVERIERDPDGPRVEAFQRSAPDLVALAERLAADGTLAKLATESLDEAVQSLWPDLLAVSEGEPG